MGCARGARGVRAGCARASEGGGALARGWERGWERDCERVLFVTICHCNKYAFIVVRWRRRGGVIFLHTALYFRFSGRDEPLGYHTRCGPNIFNYRETAFESMIESYRKPGN